MTIDDLGTQQEEFMREQALKHRMPELPKVGSCYNCGEGVKANANFCDSDCRLTYERRESQKRGKV